MQKKATTITLTILILSLAFLVCNQNTSSAATNEPTKLCIFTGSPSVLADNDTYKCIFVQLQDANGKPARALQDTTIGLSSSLMYIGTVDSSITIPQGETFASADFKSTFNPGTTAISASATGYATVLASITTIGPIPSSIGIYGFPSTLPADGNSYTAIMVQLQDSTSSPARAPQGGVQVALSSSNTTVGTVDQNVTIAEGQTCAIANFTTKQTETKIQSSIVTASSQGYAPNQVTITTTPVATNPTQLKIFSGPPKVPADKNSYKQIAVQLQNASGFVAKKQSDLMVNVASNDLSICKIDPISLKIPLNQTYALTTLNTTFKAGSAIITAVANDLPLISQSVSTVGFIPSKLAVYCIPTSLPSDGKTYEIMQVQLQDAQGRPAKDTETDVNVKLFSSQPNVGIVSSTLTIPFGKTQAIGNLWVTNSPGTTSITAQTSGYTTGQTAITTYLIDSYPIVVSVGVNGTVTPSGNTTVNLGGSQRFNFTGNTGYHIADVKVDDISQGAVSSYTFNNVTSAHKIAATFAINTYNLTVTQTANGVISPGTTIVNHGDTPNFSVTPNTGYHIANITANGVALNVTSPLGQSYKFSSVTSNSSLTATFAINTYNLTVTQTVNGAITPGTTVVNHGNYQTFVINPNFGYHVASLIVDNQTVEAASSYTFSNITVSHTITATYAITNFIIPTSAGANGAISPNGNITLSLGGSQRFKITPSTGYHIADVKVDDISQGAVSSYTFNNVTSAHKIAATFAINTYTIRVNQTSNGNISPGTTTVNFNGNQIFTIVPNTGFHINDVLINGTSVGSVSSYTVQNVQGEITILAVFEPNPSTSPSPITIPATTDSGMTVDLILNGNVTSSQISNLEISTNQSSKTTTVSFTLTGQSGTTGFGNLTIPKSNVLNETTPKIYLDEQLLSNQGYNQDDNNFYVWFTTHFSTHELSIVFTSDPFSKNATDQMGLPQGVIYALIFAIIIVTISVSLLVLKKKNIDITSKLPSWLK
jgi:hypothetical protein